MLLHTTKYEIELAEVQVSYMINLYVSSVINFVAYRSKRKACHPTPVASQGDILLEVST